MLKKILFLVAGLAVGESQAQDVLSLSDALKMAMSENKSLQSVSLETELNEAKIREVKSTAYPQLSGQAGFDDNLKLPVFLIPASAFGGPDGVFNKAQFGVPYTANATVDAQQLLYSKAYKAGVDAAGLSRDVAALNIEKSKEDLTYDIGKLYYGAYMTQKRLVLVQKSLEILQKMEKLSLARVENGLVKKSEHDRFIIQRSNLETQIQTLQGAYEQQIRYLRHFCGISADKKIALPDTLLLSNPGEFPALSEVKSENMIVYRQLMKNQSLLQAQKDVYKAQYYPSVSAFGRAAYNAQTKEFKNFFNDKVITFDQYIVGLRVNIPIYDGGKKKNQIRQTDIQMRQVGLQADYVRSLLDASAENALATYLRNQAALANQAENVVLAERMYKQAQLEYREGLSSMNELLLAETSFRETQAQYLSVLSDVLLSEWELKKATGALPKE